MDINHPAIDYIALATSMGVSARRVERATDIACPPRGRLFYQLIR
jgi:benzoylformate decarboxylase